MDLHDPDSTAKEKAIALKAGRQKKIQIIDGKHFINELYYSYIYKRPICMISKSLLPWLSNLGQQVEVLGEEEDEMEEYEDENILLDESALEGEQGTSGNVMAVQVKQKKR